MSYRDKFMLAVLVVSILSCGAGLIGAEPILVARLNPYIGISLTLAHFAVFGSLYDLYRKVSKNVLVQRADVLFTAGLVLITSSISLGTMVQISLR